MLAKFIATTTVLAAFTVPSFAQDADLSGVSEAVGAAEAAGLAQTIASSEGLTVFVPTNDAIAAGPQDAIQDLLADTEQLGSVITYYAVEGQVRAADAIALAEGAGGEAEVATLNGAPLTIVVQDGNVMIRGATGAMATVVTPDIEVGNVVLHVVDGLVLPEAPMQ